MSHIRQLVGAGRGVVVLDDYGAVWYWGLGPDDEWKWLPGPALPAHSHAPPVPPPSAVDVLSTGRSTR